jgi:hypothetical protein
MTADTRSASSCARYRPFVPDAAAHWCERHLTNVSCGNAEQALATRLLRSQAIHRTFKCSWSALKQPSRRASQASANRPNPAFARLARLIGPIPATVAARGADLRQLTVARSGENTVLANPRVTTSRDSAASGKLCSSLHVPLTPEFQLLLTPG